VNRRIYEIQAVPNLGKPAPLSFLEGSVQMTALRIALFGKVEITCHQQPVAGFDARKLQELFGYLLLYRDRLHPRETVASLLWGNGSTAHSKKCLRNALWQLQTALEPYAEHTNGCLLLIEPDWIGLNPEADYRLDVAAFEQAYALVQEIPGRELDARQAEMLKGALGIYQGELLEGSYHDWCLFERERLQNVCLAMLDKLMGYCEAQQEYGASREYASRILRYDRASERTHRRLMRSYYLAGYRTRALRQYQRCRVVLEEELGVKPGRRTDALYHQIRADEFPAPSIERTPEPERLTSLAQVLRRFQRVQTAVVDLHGQIQQDIQALQRSLEEQA
jgi:DNA-binding SARP family transcriptional activator